PQGGGAGPAGAGGGGRSAPGRGGRLERRSAAGRAAPGAGRCPCLGGRKAERGGNCAGTGGAADLRPPRGGGVGRARRGVGPAAGGPVSPPGRRDTVKNFLTLSDFTLAEHRAIFERAAELKQRRREGLVENTLAGKTLVLLMEKASTRTRLSFAAAAFQLGGSAIELTASSSQLARGEPISDTARVVSGYADAVVMRTSSDERLAELARFSSIPVINGLTDGGHPVQVLTDLFTIEEQLGAVAGKMLAFIGDGSGDMGRSFSDAAPLFGFDLQVGAPAAYSLPAADVDRAGGRVKTTTDPRLAVRNAEVVITDVWTSMGQEA